MRFQIRRSINNIYTAASLDDGRIYTCRIKGKVMKGRECEYSPIAVGDIAEGEPYSSDEALIHAVLDRKSAFQRWNTKRELNQTIAANQDISVIVVSPLSPPLRPRFLDRAIACSSGAEIIIVLNKADEADDDAYETLRLYSGLGFRVIYTSSVSGEGIDELRTALMGKCSAFVGQSGVGKSTLVNRLTGSGQRIGDISEKYNRGRHTTNHSLYIEGDGFSIIDTPGVREIEVPFEDLQKVSEAFPELPSGECLYDGCLHQGEDGCIVPELVEKGLVDENRYESYLRIIDALRDRKPAYMRNRKSRG